MSDYGSAAGVAYLVRHLSNAGTFDDTSASKVTVTAVNAFLTSCSAELNMLLASVGHTVPITTPTTAKTWLDQLCNYGAAMLCELTQASASFRGAETADTRAGAFRRLWLDGKKLLEARGLSAVGCEQGTATSQGLWSGSTEDEDGNAKDALFTRARSSSKLALGRW